MSTTADASLRHLQWTMALAIAHPVASPQARRVEFEAPSAQKSMEMDGNGQEISIASRSKPAPLDVRYVRVVVVLPEVLGAYGSSTLELAEASRCLPSILLTTMKSSK